VRSGNGEQRSRIVLVSDNPEQPDIEIYEDGESQEQRYSVIAEFVQVLDSVTWIKSAWDSLDEQRRESWLARVLSISSLARFGPVRRSGRTFSSHQEHFQRKGIPAFAEQYCDRSQPMNKIIVGLLFGAVLGAIDGATAWFTPEVRSQLAGIMVGSSIKGMLVGILSGWFARKVHSTAWGIVVGAVIGLLFAYLVAAMPAEKHYYLEIMLPGFIVGAIIGFLTQRIGTPVPAKGTT